MSSILSKADLQAYAPELDLSAYSDATISGMLSSATKRASSYCQVDGFDYTSVVDETDNATITNDGNLEISVRRRPIYSISSVALVQGNSSTNLLLSDTVGNTLYQIPYPKNKVVFPSSYFVATGTFSANLLSLRGTGMYHKISYTGGYQNPPEDLKYASLLYFRDSYQKQFNARGLSSFSQGSYSESYGGQTGSKGRSGLVQEAESVLRNGGYARMEF